jgi:hypothetical protein
MGFTLAGKQHSQSSLQQTGAHHAEALDVRTAIVITTITTNFKASLITYTTFRLLDLFLFNLIEY